MRFSRTFWLVATILVGVGGGALAAKGPNAGATPYLVPAKAGVALTTIMAVGGDTADDGSHMVGAPDGLGAYDNGDGTVTVLMNHELSTGKGIVRRHGAAGAFVSRWVVRKADLGVNAISDMIDSPSKVHTWQGAGSSWITGATAFNRLCSADLPPISAFFNRHTGRGYDGRIFMNGEEAGDQGRAFAWFATGSEAGRVWELPALGKMSWENALASPFEQDRTIVMGMDDDGFADSELYMYVGMKRESGNAVEKAGLHGGKLYALRIGGATVQNEDQTNAFGGSGGAGNGRFGMVELGEVTGKTGSELEHESMARHVSNFRRIEDGHWDPRNPNDFYFVTTDTNLAKAGRSRLWRLHFDDIGDPQNGGRIEMLLDGTEGQEMLDNMTVSPNGRVYLQEDPGSSASLARVWQYDPAGETLTELARFDAALFGSGGSESNTNEESSGIIDITDLFAGVDGYDTANNRYYLLTAQNHKSAGDAGRVEKGQLLLMKVRN
jgi:hypothetical protein